MVNKIETLLVIDDDPGIRNQLRWGLDEYYVIMAENRISALQQVALHRPAVVTLDLGLPPHSEGTQEGFEVLKDILQQAPETRVVVVSGAMDSLNEARALKSGAFGCFAKPVNMEKLRGVVEQAYHSYRLAHNHNIQESPPSDELK